MESQLIFNLENKDNCPSCSNVFGNQTWSIINNDEGTFTYCSDKCLNENHEIKEVEFLLMDYYKGKNNDNRFKKNGI